MTQYVYGKNVVKQLLQDDKKIYEIIMAEGIRDTELVDAIKQKKIPLKTMGKKKMDTMLSGNHQGIAAKIDDYKTYELEEILESRDYKKTPDDRGYYMYHDKYKAYIEVVPLDKVLYNAKQRNRAFFLKLGL